MSLASVLAQLAGGGGLPQRFRPFANQAANEAYLRFAPEWEGLNQLRAQSASTMRQNVGQANSAAQLISALANEGQRTLNATSNPLVQRLAAYDNPPAGSSSAVVAQSLGLGHDAISGMLGQAALNAPLRAAQQAQQALAAHQQDLEQIGGKRASLAGQVGAFTQGRLGDLVNADRKQRADLNKSLRQIQTQLVTSGVNPDGTVIPGGPKDPKIAHPPKPPEKPSDIAKPPANYPGSAADWNNASRADRERWLKNHPTGKKGGTASPKPTVSPAQATKFTSQATQVADILMHPPKLKNGQTATRAQILDEIRNGTSPLGKGVDPRVVHIGTSLADNQGKGIGPWGAKNARDLGIPIKWRVLPKPKRSAPLGPAGPIVS